MLAQNFEQNQTCLFIGFYNVLLTISIFLRHHSFSTILTFAKLPNVQHGLWSCSYILPLLNDIRNLTYPCLIMELGEYFVLISFLCDDFSLFSEELLHFSLHWTALFSKVYVREGKEMIKAIFLSFCTRGFLYVYVCSVKYLFLKR